MTSKEIYRIWAPVGKKWVNWVRPVPFVGMSEHSKQYNYANFAAQANVPAKEYDADAAIIVDLPGVESVVEGIALARAGYRPIPVFNGTIEQQGARATVDNQSVGVALCWGAAELSKIEIRDDALPAFLLDSNRMNRFKMEVSLFDNSWDIYPQDLPTPEYLLASGIHKVIIIGDVASKDVKKILYEFQKKKIQIYFAGRYAAPKKRKIHKQFYKN